MAQIPRLSPTGNLLLSAQDYSRLRQHDEERKIRWKAEARTNEELASYLIEFLLTNGEPKIELLNGLAFTLYKERNWFIAEAFGGGWEWQKKASDIESKDNETFTDFTMLIQAMVAHLTSLGS